MAKKRSKAFRRVWVIVITLVAMITVFYLVSREYNKPKFIHYKQFGIGIPSGYQIHGIDVSRHQQTITWKDVRNMQVNHVRIGFAFIKATEGLGRIDAQFRRNWYHAKKDSVIRGAYHFFIASKSGKAQAENFIETVKLSSGDLPPVLDVEQAYGTDISTLQERVADWLNVVEKKYGVKPIIYSNADFYKKYLSGRFDDYPLWVAHYFVRDKPRISRDWIFWQHSEKGHVNGIKPFVDFNVFKGDSTAFKKLLIR